MRMEYAPYRLRFMNPAGTSRGVLNEKLTCFIRIFDEKNPEQFGIGEAAVFEGLSKEAGAGYEIKLLETVANVALGRGTDLTDFPSIQCGLEQAILDFSNGCRGLYFPSKFTEGSETITINGLVWMGRHDEMMTRLEEKIEQGFKCVKIKIGAIDFKDELDMLAAVRKRFSRSEIELRVDANGAFNMENVFPALHALQQFDLHSIEQPIPAGNPEFMRMVCQVSPIPVALDEELIGVNRPEDKAKLLDAIMPAYIILKPSLCGGFSGASEWIQLANERNIGWWVTSALESNVGLSALSQWVGTLGVTMPQGLGTGQLFENNFTSPLRLEGEHLNFNPEGLPVDRKQFLALDWRG